MKCKCGHKEYEHQFAPWKRVCLECDCLLYRTIEKKRKERKIFNNEIKNFTINARKKAETENY